MLATGSRLAIPKPRKGRSRALSARSWAFPAEDAEISMVGAVEFTVVRCGCGEATIYRDMWITMSGWGQEIGTRHWLCPHCNEARNHG